VTENGDVSYRPIVLERLIRTLLRFINANRAVLAELRSTRTHKQHRALAVVLAIRCLLPLAFTSKAMLERVTASSLSRTDSEAVDRLHELWRTAFALFTGPLLAELSRTTEPVQHHQVAHR
jgi:hypothetical protein